jgi:hypothetical protein
MCTHILIVADKNINLCLYDTYIFFLEHTGELRIISLKGEERVIHRPKHTHTHNLRD